MRFLRILLSSIFLLGFCLVAFTEPSMKYYSRNDYKTIGESKQLKSVVLKRNLVNGVNTLTQKMLNSYGDNTKFIIKYDYSLAEDIVIPNNCELKFKGGKLRNGTVNFNHCRIESMKTALYNIRFSNLDSIDIECFDIPTDATTLLQDIANSCSFIDLKNKTFGINKVIMVDGNNGEFLFSNGTVYALPGFEIYEGEGLTSTGTLMYMSGLNKGHINNITLDGKGIAQKGLFVTQSKDVAIDECTICNCDGSDKTMSWGLRCNDCSNIELSNSNINNIVALPVGRNGGSIGSATGVVYEHTINSLITNNVIENVQSTRDGDAIHIISIPSVNSKPAPSREDLYDNVNVSISQNIIKANTNSKRCIKVQAFGVQISNNYLQKLYTNKTNVVSIYGTNVIMENNYIESNEYYTIGIGTSYLSALNNIIIRNNTIEHKIAKDWCSCIYVVGSSLKNSVVENNTVNVVNRFNSIFDVRGGLDSVKISGNKVKGGSHFFRIRNEINNAEVKDLELAGNEYEGEYDLLIIEKERDINTSYGKVNVLNNIFTGGSDSKRMIEVVNSPEATNCIRLDNNRSNKKLGL